jgi:hypothetical protein
MDNTTSPASSAPAAQPLSPPAAAHPPSYPPAHVAPPAPYYGAPPGWAPYPRRESFTTRAVITAVLYWFFWLPGFIANLVWYFEARGIERDTGQAPSGKGCLLAMLFLFCLLPLGSVALWILGATLRVWLYSQS